MTEHEKKLLQAKHRLEEAQARDRVKERKARTRKLIQEGALLFFPEGRTYSPPRRGGGISCGNRALSEGDCGICGRRWTRLHFCQTASLVHAVGKGDHFVSPLFMGWYIATPSRRLPVSTCHRQLDTDTGAEEGLLHFTVTLRKGW